MATTVVKHTYKLKRGKQAAVEKANPLLLAGEPIVVYCEDGKTRMKIGNGRDYYHDLEFIGGTGGGSDILVDNRLDIESTNPVQNKVITKELYNKVDKVPGKDLSQNDYTNIDKAKLEGIEEGATRVIVDTIQLDSESGNAISNSLVAQAITNVNATMDTKIENKVNQVIENVSLDGGQI